MPSAAGIKAGRAYIELSVNNSSMVRGLRRAQKRLLSFGSTVTSLGTKLLSVGALAATPLAISAATFATFEKQMAEVSTLLDEPLKYMDRFSAAIRQMSVEFGEGTDTLAKGLYDILSASIPAEKALGVLDVAVRAATAGITDTAVAADAITTILNSYKLDAEQAARVSDILFTIVKRGKTTFAELGPSIGNVANIAATAGVSLEELGGALALLTRQGIKTDEAVTAVRQIIATFIKPTEEAAQIAKSLGFEMSVAALKSEGLVGVFKRLEGLDPAVIGTLFPNIRALKGVLPALGNITGFEDDVRAMGNSAGATEAAYAKMARTLSKSFAKIAASGKLLLSVVGEALASNIKAVVDQVAGFIQVAAKWIQNNQRAVVTLAYIVAGTIAAGAALVTLGSAVTALGFAIGGLTSILSAVGAVAGVAFAALGALLTPVGALAAVTAGAAGVIITKLGLVSDALAWLSDAFGTLKDDASASWKGILDAISTGDFEQAAKIVVLALKLEWTRGINALENMWIKFSGWFLNLWGDMFYGARIIVEQVWAGIKSGWTELVYGMIDVWNILTTSVRSWWNDFNGYVQKSLFEVEYIAGNITGGELKDLQKAVDRNTSDKNQALEDRKNEQLRRSDQERREAITAIETERDDALKGIGDEAAAALKKRAKAQRDALKENEDDLAAARAAWANSIADATTNAEESLNQSILDQMAEERQRGYDETYNVAGPIEEASKTLQAVPDAIDAAARKLSTVGTFSSAALANIGFADTAADRTAKATEQIVKNTASMNQKLDDLGMEFG